MSDAISGSGSKLWVEANLPATHDAVGFEALTWVLVKEVTEIGEYGRQYDEITHNPIDTRITETIKGNYTEGTLPLSFASVPADAGQVILLAASELDTDMSFKIEKTDGTIDYNIGKVFSFRPSVSSGTLLTVSCQVNLNGQRITA